MWSWSGCDARDVVPEDSRGDVTAAANGDHEVGLEIIEDLVRGFLAELVDLGLGVSLGFAVRQGGMCMVCSRRVAEGGRAGI